jgi:enoyl-CoA hydratase/carnithine racemase
MEMCLGCDDIDAYTAEKWGVVNRTFPRDKIWPFVENLAARIASFPTPAIIQTKRCVNRLEMHNGHADDVLYDQNAFR